MEFLPNTANGIDNLLAGINRENGTSFTINDFSFSLPQALTDNSQSNTGITLVPGPTTPYYGNVNIQYNRLDVSRFSQNGIAYGTITKSTIYEAIDEIRNIFSTDLTIDDLVDGPITAVDPSSPDSQKTFTLITKPESVLFFGTTEITVRVARSFPVYEDGVARTFYVYSEPSALVDVPYAMESFYSDYSKNLNFKFLGNITNIKNFTVQAVHRQADGKFLFHGFFQFDWKRGQDMLPNLSASSFRMDELGTVSDVYNSFTYPFLPLLLDGSDTLFEEHPKVPFKILHSNTFIASSGTNVAGLYKLADNDSDVKADYVPGISYAPEVIRLNKEGKLYTVSPAYSGGDPTNNNKLANLRRIDRLLPTGALDPNFNTIYLSVNTYDMYPVLDIVETATGGFFVVLNPVLTCDATFSNPRVNNVPLADTSNANTAMSWNPVIKFKADGQQDHTFVSMIGYANHTAVCENYSVIKTSDVKCLVPQGERVTFLAYKQSPTTGFKYQMPSVFDEYGVPLLDSTFSELSFIKWTKIEKLVYQSNAGYAIGGKMQLLTPSVSGQGLVFSPVRNGFVFFEPSGLVKKVFTHMLPIKNVWLTEQ